MSAPTDTLSPGGSADQVQQVVTERPAARWLYFWILDHGKKNGASINSKTALNLDAKLGEALRTRAAAEAVAAAAAAAAAEAAEAAAAPEFSSDSDLDLDF